MRLDVYQCWLFSKNEKESVSAAERFHHVAFIALAHINQTTDVWNVKLL